jgi:hypothetical protein
MKAGETFAEQDEALSLQGNAGKGRIIDKREGQRYME